jgi:3-oxo-5-alpha-steroid 4-dehydrogenase 1
MTERLFYEVILILWFFIAIGIFFILLYITAPYGRYTRPGWGPSIQTRLGWLTMESISPILFTFFFFFQSSLENTFTILFLSLWLLHYLHRAFIYPFLIRNGKKPMALTIVLMAIFFNVINAYLNGRYFTLFFPRYSIRWLTDPRFLFGVFLFFTGFAINIHSDTVLRKLREGGKHNYQIPRSGAFILVSSANYFGEVIEWIGWACLTWNLAGLSFALWTAANLIPRARAHHKWYLCNFKDYPKNRRAIIPYLY